MSVDKEENNGQSVDNNKKSFIVDKYFTEIVNAWDRENQSPNHGATATHGKCTSKLSSQTQPYKVNQYL